MKKSVVLSILILSSILFADGKSIYNAKCASCHGSLGEKSALDKSKPIAGQSVTVSIRAIKAYKDGSLNQYGMGGAMKNMVKNMSDSDMAQVADYISKLK